MGSKPDANYVLDRINNDGPYSPNNCRWITKKESLRNMSTNRIIKINGDSKLLIEWAEISGLNQSVISRRIARGWTEDRLLLPSLYKR